ncbi:hypothetical protein ACEPAI_9533 [Sanghuangporus weigelae]
MPTSIAKIETFAGSNGQSVEKWIDSIEVCSRLEQVRENDRFEFALQFLSDSVTQCIRSLTVPLERISGRTWRWDWIRLKVALRGIDKQIQKHGPGNDILPQTGWLIDSVYRAKGSVVAVNTPSRHDIVAGARAAAIVEETTGKASSSSEAIRTMSDILERTPSNTWEDASKFRPSVELVTELLEMLVPNKNIH